MRADRTQLRDRSSTCTRGPRDCEACRRGRRSRGRKPKELLAASCVEPRASRAHVSHAPYCRQPCLQYLCVPRRGRFLLVAWNPHERRQPLCKYQNGKERRGKNSDQSHETASRHLVAAFSFVTGPACEPFAPCEGAAQQR